MATALVTAPVTADALQRSITRLEERLIAARSALAGLTPQEPTDEYAVIRFRKYEGVYTFAAMKVGDRWFITQDGSRTSRQGHAPKSWDQLLVWIGNRNWASIEVLS